MGDCSSCGGCGSGGGCDSGCGGRETVYSYDLRQELRNNPKDVDCEYGIDDVVYNPHTNEFLKVEGYKILLGSLHIYVEILIEGLEETGEHYLIEPYFVKREK